MNIRRRVVILAATGLMACGGTGGDEATKDGVIAAPEVQTLVAGQGFPVTESRRVGGPQREADR